jgi:hypothetical protein
MEPTTLATNSTEINREDSKTHILHEEIFLDFNQRKI